MQSRENINLENCSKLVRSLYQAPKFSNKYGFSISVQHVENYQKSVGCNINRTIILL